MLHMGTSVGAVDLGGVQRGRRIKFPTDLCTLASTSLMQVKDKAALPRFTFSHTKTARHISSLGGDL